MKKRALRRKRKHIPRKSIEFTISYWGKASYVLPWNDPIRWAKLYTNKQSS